MAGSGSGPLLRLTCPISFWGGVDPVAGVIIDPRHPECGVSIAGTILAIPATVGSSSSSAIMLELIREAKAPAAILLGLLDAILPLGVVVARELGYEPIPVIAVPWQEVESISDGITVVVHEDGRVLKGG